MLYTSEKQWPERQYLFVSLKKPTCCLGVNYDVSSSDTSLFAPKSSMLFHKTTMGGKVIVIGYLGKWS